MPTQAEKNAFDALSSEQQMQLEEESEKFFSGHVALTAHEIARQLLAGPDLTVVVDGGEKAITLVGKHEIRDIFHPNYVHFQANIGIKETREERHLRAEAWYKSTPKTAVVCLRTEE